MEHRQRLEPARTDFVRLEHSGDIHWWRLPYTSIMQAKIPVFTGARRIMIAPADPWNEDVPKVWPMTAPTAEHKYLASPITQPLSSLKKPLVGGLKLEQNRRQEQAQASDISNRAQENDLQLPRRWVSRSLANEKRRPEHIV